MTLGDVAAKAFEGKTVADDISDYEVVMHTSSIAEWLPVLQVRIDHDRRKVYLYG